MKYEYKKTIILFEAVISFCVSLFGVLHVLLKARWNIGIAEAMLICIAGMLMIHGCVCIVKAVRMKASAVFDERGIHIFGEEEIGLISWEEVDALKRLEAGRSVSRPNAMLVIAPDATLNGKLALSINRVASERIIKRYRLDEAMELLVSGQISLNELKDKKVFLFYATQNQYQQIESWWKTVRQLVYD